MMQTDKLMTQFFGKDSIVAEGMRERTFECRED